MTLSEDSETFSADPACESCNRVLPARDRMGNTCGPCYRKARATKGRPAG